MKKCFFICSLLFSSCFLNVTPSLSSQSQLVASEIQKLLSLTSETDKLMKTFYTDRGYRPYWLNNQKSIDELILALTNAPKQGLPIARYEVEKITNLLGSKDHLELAQLEILLTRKFLLHAKDVSVGIIDPTALTSSIKIAVQSPQPDEFLSALSYPSSISDYLDSLQPKDPDYLNLQLELQKLLLSEKKLSKFTVVPDKTTLEDGMSHPNIIALRAKLKELGYLDTASESESFDEELMKAVMLFQENSGLNADGVVGRKTIHALNVPIRTRIIQVLVNLERMRWLNFDLGNHYIIVNQPNYKAQLVKSDNVLWESKVVIGLPDFQTAEFFDQMTHIIVNPTWHVPKSIAIDEYLPKIQQDPEFLTNNEMQLYVRGTSKVIDSNLIDMSVFTVDNFPFEIKQNPGNINALGQVKFMFPNKFSIYMHDTPMKPLFSKDLRAFSHGCVRVERPFEFANALLTDDEEIKSPQFYSALSSGTETQLNLAEAIPVYLTYRTVIFDDFGTVNYRPDIYGRDALIYMSLVSSGLDLDA